MIKFFNAGFIYLIQKIYVISKMSNYGPSEINQLTALKSKVSKAIHNKYPTHRELTALL